MITYLFGKSPFRDNTLDSMLSIIDFQVQAGQTVNLVLMHDAVLAARKGNSFEHKLRPLHQHGVKIFFRSEDLAAQGIAAPDQVEFSNPLDTKGIMDISARADTLASFL